MSGAAWEAGGRVQSVGYGSNEWTDPNEQHTANSQRSLLPQLPFESDDIGFQFTPRPIAISNKARAAGITLPSAPSSALGNEPCKLPDPLIQRDIDIPLPTGSILERLQRRRRMPLKMQEGPPQQPHGSPSIAPVQDLSGGAANTERSTTNASTQRALSNPIDDPPMERVGISQQIMRYANSENLRDLVDQLC
jgi:hypothetical protein